MVSSAKTELPSARHTHAAPLPPLQFVSPDVEARWQSSCSGRPAAQSCPAWTRDSVAAPSALCAPRTAQMASRAAQAPSRVENRAEIHGRLLTRCVQNADEATGAKSRRCWSRTMRTLCGEPCPRCCRCARRFGSPWTNVSPARRPKKWNLQKKITKIFKRTGWCGIFVWQNFNISRWQVEICLSC